MADQSPPLSSSAADPVIQVANVSFRYGQHEALKDVALSVEKNQIFGLLGPNGKVVECVPSPNAYCRINRASLYKNSGLQLKQLLG